MPQPGNPPPLRASRWAGMSVTNKILLGVAPIPGLIIAGAIVLRLFGLLVPFSLPTGSMIPAVCPGDHVFMEGLTFLLRPPRRGDVVVFQTTGISGLPQSTFYIKRVAGLPNEHVQIRDGRLLINNRLVALRNQRGEIAYNPPPFPETSAFASDVTIPGGNYFLLGDNSTNSLDSRSFGCVPRQNIVGRVAMCYWPPNRMGRIR